MIVAQPLRGQDPVLLNPRSKTMYNPLTAHAVEQMRAQAVNPRLQVAPLRGGLGAVDIPDWAYWLAGGLAAGVAVGAAVYFVKR